MDAPSRMIWCRHCRCGLAWARPRDPDLCPKCDEKGDWLSMVPDPKVPYALTFNDRRFLRSLKVEASDDL